MKLEIEGNKIRLRSDTGRSLIVHWRHDDGTDIVSLSVSDGHMEACGQLPSVEFTKRDTILRHIGNRIEKVQ